MIKKVLTIIWHSYDKMKSKNTTLLELFQNLTEKVRRTSGVGGGEFTKTLRKVCTCQKLKFSFLLLEYCKIRECYAVANAFTNTTLLELFQNLTEKNTHTVGNLPKS
jgi:hypothetical protein